MTNTFFTLAAGEAGGSINSFIMIALMFVVMWVVMIRPQQKRQKALKAKQDALKIGDKVITIGGMHATVNSVSEQTVSLRIADNVFVKYDKSAIATTVTKTEEKASK